MVKLTKQKGGKKGKPAQKGGSSCPPGELCLQTSTVIISFLAVIIIGYLYYQNVHLTSNIEKSRKVSFDLNKNETYKYDSNHASDSNHSNQANNNNNNNSYKMEHGLVSQNPHVRNARQHSYQNRLVEHNYDRNINPTLPRERQFPNTYGIPININTRGITGTQQIGILYKEATANESSNIGVGDSKIIPLYGRPTYPGSNKWAYHTATDGPHVLRMPIKVNGRVCNQDNGCSELSTDDSVTVDAYNGTFKIQLHDHDTPTYIPHII
jgi:hypothetical protein